MSFTLVFLTGACFGLRIWGEGGAGMHSGESALGGSTFDSGFRSSFLSFNTFLPNCQQKSNCCNECSPCAAVVLEAVRPEFDIGVAGYRFGVPKGALS